MTAPARAGPAVLHAVQPTEAGAARYVAAAAADQRSRGWRVVVACPPGGRLPSELAALRVPWLAWPAARGAGPRTGLEARRLARLVRRVRPDVVHLHSSTAGLAGRLALRGRVPTLFQPHGWSWLAAEGATARAALAWERHGAGWADVLLCAGDGEAELARRAGLLGRLVVVHNGVDLTRFAPAGPVRRTLARTVLGVSATAPLVLCLGRITRQKGQDVLLAAWRRVRDRCPDAELALVGDGDELAPLLRGPVPGGVWFAPPAADPRAWYAAADVVVLPSRWEGLSLTLLEAMASGRPVVGSDIPGIAEALPPAAGALVPAGDPAPLADALVRRLTSAALRAGEGRGARRAAECFDLRHTHDRLAALTAAITGHPAGTPPQAGRSPAPSGPVPRSA